MPNKHPLYLRMYNDRHLVALVRLVGYAGMPDPTFCEEYRKLTEQFGTEKMSAGYNELMQVDSTTHPATIRLKPEARKLACGLLGHDPLIPEVEPWWRKPQDKEPVKKPAPKPRKPRAKKRKAERSDP